MKKSVQRATLILALGGALVTLVESLPAQLVTRASFEDVVSTQVYLDRAGFSVGVIDGQLGTNTRLAVAAYEQARGAIADAATPQPLIEYVITEADVAGPFQPHIPEDLVAQGALPALSYTRVEELLAERLHTTEKTLKRLNPNSSFQPGARVVVPNVEQMVQPAESRRRDQPGEHANAADRIVVTKEPSALRVFDAAGSSLFYAPVTSGSEHDPLPIGRWKVADVYMAPKFHYNPELFWDADPSHAKTIIPPGPNNPVGLVWIDIDKEHYGLHGTPKPETVGKASSHGCVRLTNWDALRVASFVKPGTTVIFDETFTQ